MKMKFILSLAVLFPLLSQAQQQAAAAPKATYMSNGVFITLMIVIIILAIMIAGMVEMVKASATHRTRKVKEKLNSGEMKPIDENEGTNIHRNLSVLLVFFLLPFVMNAQEAVAASPDKAAAAAEPVFDYWGLGAQMFFVMATVIFIEMVIFYVLYRTGMNLLRERREIIPKKSMLSESRLLKSITEANTPEEEDAIMMDHEYDGIRELDNNLPLWWKYGFYLTIVVAVIYLFNYHIFGDWSSKAEFEKEVADGDAQVAEYKKNNAGAVDENNVIQLMDAASIAAGKGIFSQNCAACHGPNAQGLVGPNLTDDYWLHKGSVVDVFKSVKYGWADKGMKSWQQDLKPQEIQQVVSFILSLRGSNPPNPKEPQGDKFVPEGAAPLPDADTAKADSVK